MNPMLDSSTTPRLMETTLQQKTQDIQTLQKQGDLGNQKMKGKKKKRNNDCICISVNLTQFMLFPAKFVLQKFLSSEDP